MSTIASQPDLFAVPRLSGLSPVGSVITPYDEQALIRSIDTVKLSPFRYHDWLGKRLTA
jgi:DNA oxidative demethylase